MLVLSRRRGEQIVVMDEDGYEVVAIWVTGIQGNSVRIGIEAPHLAILRKDRDGNIEGRRRPGGREVSG
jgi:carbon storage regulator CsrA